MAKCKLVFRSKEAKRKYEAYKHMHGLASGSKPRRRRRGK
jgi:hypothetical protein